MAAIGTGGGPASSPLPLCVDLDGTLLRSDLLLEALVSLLRRNPFEIFRVAALLLRGRAAVKAFLASAIPVDVSQLPVNHELLALLRVRKRNGLTNLLVTAADRRNAEAVAAHFDVFDEVLASDGVTNLKGEAKARALASRFPQGFAYAGNAMADLPVWNRAERILAVNASPRVVARARLLRKPMEVVDPAPSTLVALLRAMRPRHWAKNALVFVPALTSHRYLEPETLLLCLLAAVALSFVASATYLVNDVFDTDYDRRHAGKRGRAIAAGDLAVGVALCAAAALAAAGLAIGFLQGARTGLTLLLYVAITFLYSTVLKAIPIVDVLILSGLYILRIVLGIVAIDSEFSPWLLAFAGSLFLSIALAKRYTEVARYGVVDESVAGRGYSPSDAHSLRTTGLAAGGSAIALFALYLLQDAVPAALYARIDWLWAIVALLAVWLARIWFVAAHGRLQDDPVDFALRDRVSLALGGAVVVAFLAAG